MYRLDEATGIFYWRKNIGPAKAGEPAGWLDGKGYWCLRFKGRQWFAHRLVVLYVDGYLPKDEIDHIDRNGLNNRRGNLREVPRIQNARNNGVRRDNKSGVVGVYWAVTDRRWVPQITINKKAIRLGNFTDFDEAVCQRLVAEQCFEFNSGGSDSSAFKYVRDLFV